jgi:DnaJ-class molecular chaperone
MDGEALCIERSEVTPPSWTSVYLGLGMPCPENGGRRSDLIVKVDVEYPETISPYQDKIFKRILSPKTDLSPRMQMLLSDEQN